MTYKSEEIQPMSTLWMILFSIIILHGTAPIVGRSISTFLTTYFMLSVMISIYLFFLRDPLDQWIKYTIPMLFICAINCMYDICKNGESSTISIYGSLLSLCPVLMGTRLKTLPYSQIKTLFIITAIAISVTVITTINGLTIYSGASRTMASFEESDNPLLIKYEWLNIGGFTFTYMLLTLYPMIIGIIRETYDKLWIKILIIWLLATYFFKAEYMTALTGFSILTSLWFIPKRMSQTNLFIVIITLFVFLLLFNDVIADLLYYSAASSNSKILEARMTYMADDLVGVENTSDVGKREDALMISFNGILHSPLIGNWETGLWNGGHSYIMDFVSLFGIVGLILIILSYKEIFRQYYFRYRYTSYYKYGLMSFITAICLSIVNTGSHWFELTLCIPLSLRMIESIKAKRS